MTQVTQTAELSSEQSSLQFNVQVNSPAAIQTFINIEIESRVLNQVRQLIVSLPQGYSDSSNTRYPVMYLLDGEKQIAHTSGSASYLASGDSGEKMIIVGINNVERFYDLTPSQDDDRKEPTGGGEKLLDFIEKEVIPLINQQYRTVDYKIFTGHSLGGLMVLHALATRSELFNAYFAFSPSLWFKQFSTIDLLVDSLKDQPQLQRFVYVSLGDEQGPMRAGFDRLVEAVKPVIPCGSDVTFECLPQDSHFTIALQSQVNAFKALYYQWRIPKTKYDEGIEAVKAFYQQRTERFGYPIIPSEAGLEDMARHMLNVRQQIDAAVDIFALNVSYHPDSAKVYDSLAYGYQQQGKLEQALLMVDKALAIGGIRDSNYASFVDHKQQLLAMMAD